jgi:heme oxygenase
MWNEFRDRLDDYGRDRPPSRNDVVAGAQSTFQSLLTWFSSARSWNQCDHET